MEVLQEIRSDRTTRRVAAYSPEANDVRDTSHCDNGVSDGSGRQNKDVPSNKPRCQRKRETTSQGRVDRRKEEGEKGRKSSGRVDEKVTAASGKGATDHRAGGVSLVKPTSSQDNVPGTHVDTPSPPPPSTPNLPFGQPAPTPRWSTYQRRRDGQVPHTGTRCTREDDEWSRRGVESRE
jgi:hypothetical protein